MTQEHEDLIYEGIRRMVIWGEPRDDVYHRMEVNGISGAKAAELYERAWAERLLMIRADSLRTAAWASSLLVAGGGAVAGMCWLGVICRPILGLSAAAIVIGGWRFSKGAFGFLFPKSRGGSLADEE